MKRITYVPINSSSLLIEENDCLNLGTIIEPYHALSLCQIVLGSKTLAYDLLSHKIVSLVLVIVMTN